MSSGHVVSVTVPFYEDCVRILYHPSRTEEAIFFFKFIRPNMKGEIMEKDRKTIVWVENVFRFRGEN